MLFRLDNYWLNHLHSLDSVTSDEDIRSKVALINICLWDKASKSLDRIHIRKKTLIRLHAENLTSNWLFQLNGKENLHHRRRVSYRLSLENFRKVRRSFVQHPLSNDLLVWSKKLHRELVQLTNLRLDKAKNKTRKTYKASS